MILSVCLFVLWLKVPVNNVSVMSGMEPLLPGYYQYFLGIKCLAQGQNTAERGSEPLISRSGIRCSTNEPPRSPSQ